MKECSDYKEFGLEKIYGMYSFGDRKLKASIPKTIYKEFKRVHIELTAMTVIAVIKTYTTSERMAYRILHLENAHSAFDVKYKNRLRKHLREILSNHLGIEEK